MAARLSARVPLRHRWPSAPPLSQRSGTTESRVRGTDRSRRDEELRNHPTVGACGDASGLEAVERRTRDRGFLAEVLELEHLRRVRTGDGHESLVLHERGTLPLRAFLVHDIEELALD